MLTAETTLRATIGYLGVFMVACSGSPNDDALNGGSSSGGPAGSSGVSGGSGGTSSSGGQAGAVTSAGSGGQASGGVTSGGTAGSGGSSGANQGGSGGGLVPFEPPACAEGSSTELPETAPTLTPGMFVDISPPGVPFGPDAKAITQGMTIDPCNPATIYVCVGDEEHGIYRSTDGGGTWTKLDHGGGFPVRVRVDPADPLHLYVGDGVRGGNNGFFHSTDGGQTWSIPQAFRDFAETIGSYDVYHVEPDPTDFSHVLVSFHSGWKSESENGVIESFDAGITWNKAGMPGAGANDGTDVYFLYEPTLGIGDSQTWLFGTQGNGHWRTTNSGDSWTKVTEVSMEHGGGSKYYTADGVLYISSNQGVLKSTDNGESFELIGPYNGYLSVIGDGTHLFAGKHFDSRFTTALESDDANWMDYNDQTFLEGPFEMAFDSVNGILYAANVRAGVFALKLE